MSVRRVYVEKKPEFAVKAGELREEISSYLGIETVTGVRVLVRYDVPSGTGDDLFRAAGGLCVRGDIPACGGRHDFLCGISSGTV